MTGTERCRTYFALRVGLLFLTMLFIATIWIWSWRHFGTLKPGPSISGYYHVREALIEGAERKYFVIGDVLVGSLTAVGIMLMLYRGFTLSEDWALNIGGALLMGVALFPCGECEAPGKWLGEAAPDPACVQESDAETDKGLLQKLSAHGVCAIGFFVCIAISMRAASGSVASMDRVGSRYAFYTCYSILGVAIVVLPLAIWLGFAQFERNSQEHSPMIFFLEVAGVAVFWLYWLIKTWELYHRDEVEDELIRTYLGR